MVFSSKHTPSSINFGCGVLLHSIFKFSTFYGSGKLLSFFQWKGAASTLWIYWFVSSKPDINSFTHSSNRISESRFLIFESHFQIFACWLSHCMTILHFLMRKWTMEVVFRSIWGSLSTFILPYLFNTVHILWRLALLLPTPLHYTFKA